MRRVIAAVIVVAVGAGVVLFLPRRGQSPPSTPVQTPTDASPTAPAASTQRVATADRSVVELFATSCASCHGEGGKGDGSNAAMLDPRPRDFTTQSLRFAATGGTREQMMAAVERTIGRGLPHSGMPGFRAVMSASEIRALAELVLARGGENNKESPVGTELAIPKPPEFTPGLIERGREAYLANICASCHGPQGQANGAGAPGLTDMEGNPIRPADLSSPLHKSGDTPQDLYRTILMGVPGTPMAGYKPMVARSGPGGSVDDRDAWALVALIESFSPPSPPLPEPTVPISGMKQKYSEEGWFDIRPVRVMLHHAEYAPGSPTTVDIRAIRGDDGFTLRFSGKGLPLATARVVLAFRDQAAAPLVTIPATLPKGYESLQTDERSNAVYAGGTMPHREYAEDLVFQVIFATPDPADTLFSGWIWLKNR